MISGAPFALSLALQRSYPRLYDHVARLTRERRLGTSPQLSWPAWCGFPVGLAHDVLVQHYNYRQQGVEPFLFSAMAGWRIERRAMLLSARQARLLHEIPECNDVPVSELYKLPWKCLYLEYPDTLPEMLQGALGSFLFMDYYGPGQEQLVMLLHLDTYSVEPICFPITGKDRTLADMYDDWRGAMEKRPSNVDESLFGLSMVLCRINLGVISHICGRHEELGEEALLN